MDFSIYSPARLYPVILANGPHLVEGRLGQVVVEGVGKPPPRRLLSLAGPLISLLFPGGKITLEFETQTSNVPAKKAQDDGAGMSRLSRQHMGYL